MTILDEIRQLEEALAAKKREAAAEIYAKRHELKLSLTQVARSVRVSAPTVQRAEKGTDYSTRTFGRLLRYYDRRIRKANGQEAAIAPDR